MLRTNLATRPFYNERLVHLGIGVLALVVLGLTAYNVLQILNLSASHSELTARAAREEAAATERDRQALAVRQQIDAVKLKAIAQAAREANAIIDQRTFSWTELFNRIEATLPPDVMITSLRPSISDGNVSLTIAVVGRRVEDIDAFIEKLEATGAFSEVLNRAEEVTDTGTYRAVLQGRYSPGTV